VLFKTVGQLGLEAAYLVDELGDHRDERGG
jgi:hypothetical protein